METNISEFFKSIVDHDPNQIVICNLDHEIIYMNPKAVKDYEKWGGSRLIGKNLMNCHNSESQEKITKVINWFQQSEDHNIIHTFYSQKHDWDVYMVALRSEGHLIGYYEKHEVRTKDSTPFYNF